MSDSVQTDTSATIGQRLMAARERLGQSVAGVAEKTHLDTTVITALEADRFEAIGSPVYVRGHLKLYAEFLELPAAELLADYRKDASAEQRPDLTRIAKAERPSDPRKWRGPLLAALLAVALAAGAWWLLRKPAPQPVESAATVVSPAVDVTAPLGSLPESAAAAEVSAAGEPAAPTPSTVPSAAGVTVPTQTTVAPMAAANTTELRVSLSADSWVEVYDARGRQLYHDVATGGSVQSFRGRAPIRLVLGNFSAATLAVDGRDVAIPASAVRGKVATLVVSTTGSVAPAR
ncbi:MAG: DUF4115 domain-containing protein [Proteobacteria bacterium]|nr:DUF4115 domain-containing protein [Pseudomonadota bacterium]